MTCQCTSIQKCNCNNLEFSSSHFYHFNNRVKEQKTNNIIKPPINFPSHTWPLDGSILLQPSQIRVCSAKPGTAVVSSSNSSNSSGSNCADPQHGPEPVLHVPGSRWVSRRAGRRAAAAEQSRSPLSAHRLQARSQLFVHLRRTNGRLHHAFRR
jgi:hypothetical protein